MQSEPDEMRRAEEALVAFGAAQSIQETMRVCRDYHQALLSVAAQNLVRDRANKRRASGDKQGAEQLEETYRGLRERLQSSEFMESVHRSLARKLRPLPGTPLAQDFIKQVSDKNNFARSLRDKGLHEQAEAAYIELVALDKLVSDVIAGELWKQRGINQSEWGTQIARSKDLAGAKPHFDLAVVCLNQALFFNLTDEDALTYHAALHDMLRKLYP